MKYRSITFVQAYKGQQDGLGIAEYQTRSNGVYTKVGNYCQKKLAVFLPRTQDEFSELACVSF